MQNLRLTPASCTDSFAVYYMLQDIGAGENGFHNDGYPLRREDFALYLADRISLAQGIELVPGYVPTTTYWLFYGDYPLGTSKLRHYLNDTLRENGGHIGYCIRPGQRGRGWGKQLLRLTLLEAGRREIKEVLLTCRAQNQPSRRVIECNQGELERIRDKMCYYWIKT